VAVLLSCIVAYLYVSHQTTTATTTVVASTVAPCCDCTPVARAPIYTQVTCSGGCECLPSINTKNGTISDGPSDYKDFATCTWLIQSFSVISLSFTSFNTEAGYDFVTINSCSESSCGTRVQLARLSGAGNTSAVYTSPQFMGAQNLSTYLQVVFTSDEDKVSSGFVASWSAGEQNCQGCCSSATTTAAPITTPAPRARVNVSCSASSGYTGCETLGQPAAQSVTYLGTCGTFSDGPGNYLSNANVVWLLQYSDIISLRFTSFETQNDYDFVTIYNCSESSCNTSVELAKLSGKVDSMLPKNVNLLNTVYQASILQVVFTSDPLADKVGPGFVASWSVGNAADNCTASVAILLNSTQVANVTDPVTPNVTNITYLTTSKSTTSTPLPLVMCLSVE
jgi:hypothetical protein